MQDTKTKLPHATLNKDMLAFYHALGTFNTNIVSRLLEDPNSVDKLTELLVKYCEVHDAECGNGYLYDHVRNSCMKLAEGVDPNA